jgi:hypothetical protein
VAREATVSLVGLAMILALVLGVATTALGASVPTFKLSNCTHEEFTERGKQNDGF